MSKENNTSQSFLITSSERIQTADEIIAILSYSLNEIHKTSYSERFWRIILAPYESAIYTCRHILDQRETKSKPVTILHTNTLELDINTIIFSKVRYLLKIYKTFRGLKKIKLALNKSKNIAMGSSFSNNMLSKIDSHLEAYYPFLRNKKTNHKKRSINLEYPANYSKEFIDNVVKLIPKVYVENFEGLMNKIPLINPKEKTFHVTIFHSLFMRFVVAKYVENGAKLYFYQHGGFYGEYKYHNAHHFEGKIADKFMTWGWKIRSNDVPYRAYRLEKFRKNYISLENKLYDILLIYPIIRNRNFEYVKNESDVFFKKINRSNYPVICSRPRPIAKFNRKSSLSFIPKNLCTIDSGFTNISGLISKSKLIIIFTHPSTTLLECLYIDKPTVAILDNDNEHTEIVKPHYDFLLEKGLLHNSMDSLVKHINSVDIDLWWNELIIHPKYLGFKHEFLRKE